MSAVFSVFCWLSHSRVLPMQKLRSDYPTVNQWTLWQRDTCYLWTLLLCTDFSIHYLMWGDSLQAVNTLSISIFAHIMLIFMTDLAWNLWCSFSTHGSSKTRSSAWASICFQHRINNVERCICRLFSAFIQRFWLIATTLSEKWHPEEKVLHRSRSCKSWN